MSDDIMPPVPKGTVIVPICIAQPLGGIEPRRAVIQMVRPIPEFKTLDAAKAYYDTEADMVAKALFEALPQGTLDRIMLHLMKRQLSCYRGVTGS